MIRLYSIFKIATNFDKVCLFADCPSTTTNPILSVNYVGSAYYNTLGELVCTNNGALFLNDQFLSTTETVCNVTAQWTIPDNVDCYTGKKSKFELAMLRINTLPKWIDLLSTVITAFFHFGIELRRNANSFR